MIPMVLWGTYIVVVPQTSWMIAVLGRRGRRRAVTDPRSGACLAGVGGNRRGSAIHRAEARRRRGAEVPGHAQRQGRHVVLSEANIAGVSRHSARGRMRSRRFRMTARSRHHTRACRFSGSSVVVLPHVEDTAIYTAQSRRTPPLPRTGKRRERASFCIGVFSCFLMMMY